MGSVEMNVDSDYGLIGDLEAYLRASPHLTQDLQKPALQQNGRSGGAHPADNTRRVSGDRRGPRRPLSVIGDDAVLDVASVALEQAHNGGGHASNNNNNNAHGFDFGNHAYGNISDMGYFTSANGSASNRAGGKLYTSTSKKEEELKLPAISGVNSSSHNNNHLSNDRAKSYEPNGAMTHHNTKHGYTPTTTTTPPSANHYGNSNVYYNNNNSRNHKHGMTEASSRPGGERKFSTAPNGRVSPLKGLSIALNTATTGANANSNNNTTKSNGWVKEQARKLDEEIRMNSPMVENFNGGGGFLGSNGSVKGNNSPGKTRQAEGKGKLSSGWEDGGYNLGIALDSLPDLSSQRSGNNLTDNNNSSNNNHKSVFPSSPMAAAAARKVLVTPTQKPSAQPTKASNKKSAGPTPQPPQSGAPVTTFQRNKANNRNGNTSKTHANNTEEEGVEFQQMPKAESGGRSSNSIKTGPTSHLPAASNNTNAANTNQRLPPWRVAQQQLTSNSGDAGKTATTQGPTAANAKHHNNNNDNAVLNSTTVSGSNPVTPSHNRRIKMEAVDTSALPSIIGSFTTSPNPDGNAKNEHFAIPITTTSAPHPPHNAKTAAGAAPSPAASLGVNGKHAGSKDDGDSSLLPYYNSEGTPINAAGEPVLPCSLPLTSAASVRAHVAMPYSAADCRNMTAWQDNFQLLTHKPADMHNALHLKTKEDLEYDRQWYRRGKMVPVEMAGEAVELDAKMHNVFTLMRHRQRPLVFDYPPVLPVPLEIQTVKRRPRTPRSFYGPPMPHVGKDWFKNALDDAIVVPSPNLAALDKLDGNKKQRGGAR